MGDRTVTMIKCPECEVMVELYDAPSSLIYSARCDNCGWEEPLDYYEIGKNQIMLCTYEHYRKACMLIPWVKAYRKELAEDIRENRKGFRR